MQSNGSAYGDTCTGLRTHLAASAAPPITLISFLSSFGLLVFFFQPEGVLHLEYILVYHNFQSLQETSYRQLGLENTVDQPFSYEQLEIPIIGMDKNFKPLGELSVE